MRVILFYFMFISLLFIDIESKGINGFTDRNDLEEPVTTPTMPAVELQCNIIIIIIYYIIIKV